MGHTRWAIYVVHRVDLPRGISSERVLRPELGRRAVATGVEHTAGFYLPGLWSSAWQVDLDWIARDNPLRCLGRLPSVRRNAVPDPY